VQKDSAACISFYSCRWPYKTTKISVNVSAVSFHEKGKCNVVPVHVMQGEWRFSCIEAKAAQTQQSIPTFVWT
jgi:hypothetical protein